jgi:hypothetical protein
VEANISANTTATMLLVILNGIKSIM